MSQTRRVNPGLIALLLSGGLLTLATLWYRAVQADHRAALADHTTAADLGSALEAWRVQPLAVLRGTDADADAAAWILSAARTAGVSDAQVSVRQSDSASTHPGERKRTVISAFERVTAPQADAILNSLREKTPPWTVRDIRIERSNRQSERTTGIRLTFTLEARLT